MRATRLFLALVLVLAAAPSRAEWVEVDKIEKGFFSAFTGDAVYYFDPATIVREGEFRRVWEIHDLRDKGSQGERSVLALVEYDCEGKRMRTLKATGRSLKMATGQIIPLSRVLDDWIILRPGNEEDRILFQALAAVCAR